MTVFCYKKLDATVPLCQKLTAARTERGMSAQELSSKTHIPLKYVAALESGSFALLPQAKAYRLAYVRQYAGLVGLHADQCAQQFEHEGGIDTAARIHPHQSIKLFPFSSIALFARNATFVGLALFFAGYLLWQIQSVVKPPQLAVYSPLEGHVITALSTIIQGETERETRLTVNGQEIMVNEQGIFEAKIDLNRGVNTIVVAAAKKHGQTTTITRHIIVRAAPVEKISLQ